MPPTTPPPPPPAPVFRPWTDIADDDTYRQLDEAGKHQTRVEYFRMAILPTLERGTEQDAWDEFRKHADEVDSFLHRSLRAAERFVPGAR